jgi:hypothetical protein
MKSVLLVVLGLLSLHLGGDRRAPAKQNSVKGVYRHLEETVTYHGRKFDVWIVDGDRIRDTVYPEWLYGGNGERYRFNPKGEIWIDNAITCGEYRYTLAHELLERDLMARFRMTYGDAHDSALMLEDSMRHADKAESISHEAALGAVPPMDDDSTKELEWLPDSVRLHQIYLQHFERIDSLDVWIVDGNAVRRDIFPDFGFSGNDLAYLFIPQREIWLDDAMSTDDILFSILTEKRERELMSRQIVYDSAYTTALTEARAHMRRLFRDAARHPTVLVPTPPDRDTGTGSEGIIHAGLSRDTH